MWFGPLELTSNEPLKILWEENYAKTEFGRAERGGLAGRVTSLGTKSEATMPGRDNFIEKVIATEKLRGLPPMDDELAIKVFVLSVLS